MRLTLGADLELPTQHALCSRTNCFHICSKDAFHTCSAAFTFVRQTFQLARGNVVCRQRNVSTPGWAGKKFQVRLANNTTDNREVG